jgi:DNA-binding transcriptional ArsR family regulator
MEAKTNLKKLYEIYQKNLYIEDTDRIDVVLATALSRKIDGIPIWLILVGASGDMKSVQLSAIDDDYTFVLHNLTSKTLVNGYPDKTKFPDLAPELNNKLVIIPDMAQILKLPPNEKAELWGQLRDLYDGLAGKFSGQGSRASYKNLKVTLIAAATPSIDGQILIHQDLGTRELIYRTSGNTNKNDLMDKCFYNEEFETNIKKQIKDVTNNFLFHTQIIREEIKSDVLEELKKISVYISIMRSTAEIEQYTNTLRNDVYPEEPTRIAKQLKRLYICLKSLDKDYTDESAIRILWHIGKSSAFPLRIKVFELLNKTLMEYSTSQIAEILHIGKSTAQRELSVLWNLNLVRLRREETKFPDKFYDYWTIDVTHPFIKSLNNSSKFRP